MGNAGIGRCTTISQARQLSFGRICWITLKLDGTYSSTSRSSCPIRLNTVLPQPGQTQGGSWVIVSRGRCAGSGLRTGCLRSRVWAGCGWAGSAALARAEVSKVPRAERVE